MRSMGNGAIAAIQADVSVCIVMLCHGSGGLFLSWCRILRSANIENDELLVSECAPEVALQVARKLAIVFEPPKRRRRKDDEFSLMLAKPLKLPNRMRIVLRLSPIMPVLFQKWHNMSSVECGV